MRQLKGSITTTVRLDEYLTKFEFVVEFNLLEVRAHEEGEKYFTFQNAKQKTELFKSCFN